MKKALAIISLSVLTSGLSYQSNVVYGAISKPEVAVKFLISERVDRILTKIGNQEIVKNNTFEGLENAKNSLLKMSDSEVSKIAKDIKRKNDLEEFDNFVASINDDELSRIFKISRKQKSQISKKLKLSKFSLPVPEKIQVIQKIESFEKSLKENKLASVMEDLILGSYGIGDNNTRLIVELIDKKI